MWRNAGAADGRRGARGAALRLARQPWVRVRRAACPGSGARSRPRRRAAARGRRSRHRGGPRLRPSRRRSALG